MKNIFRLLSSFPVIALIILTQGCGNNENASTDPGQDTIRSKEVNVYSQRHYETDDSLYALFTEKTGIKVNLIKAKADELINKIEMEGKHSPADLFVTVDAERLYRAKEKGLLQPANSEILNTITPEFRDTNGYWYALTFRARVLVYNKEKVKAENLSTYEALTDKKWKGKILVRSSESGYNQALLSSIIAANGAEAAKSWAEGVVKNMARDPKGNDRDQIKAVAAGAGDIAIVNSYYLALMNTSADQTERDVASKVGVFFPNQENRGAHINISGVGLAAHSPNKENAIQLMEFLVSPEAQEYFTKTNGEYPVRKDVKPAELLESWGTFKADFASLLLLEKHHNEAVKIFHEVGWK